MPKVSIIMPSLNVEKYIRECMESVINQTLQDIEIIAIDAGSTDGTFEIIQEYAYRDKRIKVVHSDRKSYGYQVNMGISLAQGEYVGVVETDDIIADDMFETLYRKAIQVEADYVKGRAVQFVDVGDDSSFELPTGSGPNNSQLMGKVLQPSMMPELLVQDIYLWTGIYRKDFIKDIHLNETSGAAFQDQGFLFQTISTANKAVYLDKFIYKYRQDNVTSSIFNTKGFHYLVEEYAYIEQFVGSKSREWKSAYYQRMLNQCMGRVRTMAVSGNIWENIEADVEILQNRLSSAVENEIVRKTDFSVDNWELLQKFLEGIDVIYSYYTKIYGKKRQHLCDIFKTIADQKIVIFCCTIHGKFFHALAENARKGQVAAYCDNNPKLWNLTLQGVKIVSPEQAVKLYPDAVYVVANLKSTDIIKAQLYNLGVSEYRICEFAENPDWLLFNCVDKTEMII